MKALPYLKFAQEHNVLQDPIMQPGTGRAMSPLGSGAWGAGLGALGGLGWAGVSHLRRKLQGEEGLDGYLGEPDFRVLSRLTLPGALRLEGRVMHAERKLSVKAFLRSQSESSRCQAADVPGGVGQTGLQGRA